MMLSASSAFFPDSAVKADDVHAERRFSVIGLASICLGMRL